MRATCPKCHEVIPADNIALKTGWAKCVRCNEVFQLAEVLEGQPAGWEPQPVPQRPFDARAIVERWPEKLMVHVPATGLKAGHFRLLGFALFWLGFTAFWTAAASGILFNGFKGSFRWERVLFACFSIPFWLVGFGMVVGVFWSAWGKLTALMDASWLVTESRGPFWRRRRRIDRFRVQHARQGYRIPARLHDPDAGEAGWAGLAQGPWFVEIVFEKGAFKLPCTTQAEGDWLAAEINDFLRTVPYRPPAGGDRFPEERRFGFD
ncbi:MAG: hypothetical protein ACUVUC_15435 [Thermoguttaceae bacterium]